jgi:hypothetical protein
MAAFSNKSCGLSTVFRHAAMVLPNGAWKSGDSEQHGTLRSIAHDGTARLESCRLSCRQIGSPILANKKWLHGKSECRTMKIVVGNFITLRSISTRPARTIHKTQTLIILSSNQYVHSPNSYLHIISLLSLATNHKTNNSCHRSNSNDGDDLCCALRQRKSAR